MQQQPPPLERAAKRVQGFGSAGGLRHRISTLERETSGRNSTAVRKLLVDEGLDPDLFVAAAALKSAAGQIDVVIHAVGILISLPRLLERGEVVESLSLGAGNTGREHDLETDRRIAEFKFVTWRGGSETIRQNDVFADVFGLASAKTTKRRVLYLLGTDQALRFLSGRRAISSVLSRSPKVRRRFVSAYGQEGYARVCDYWQTVEHMVDIVDLRELVPELVS